MYLNIVLSFTSLLLFSYQLSQEAEAVREQMNELDNQKVTFEESKVQEEQVLNEKENQIKVLALFFGFSGYLATVLYLMEIQMLLKLLLLLCLLSHPFLKIHKYVC